MTAGAPENPRTAALGWGPAGLVCAVILLVNLGILAWFELRLVPRLDARPAGAAAPAAGGALEGSPSGGASSKGSQQSEAALAAYLARLDASTSAEISALAASKGLPEEMFASPSDLFRNMYYSGHLLPEGVVEEELARKAPELLQGNEDRYVRNSLLLHVVTIAEQAGGGAGDPLAAGVAGLVGAELPAGSPGADSSSYCIELDGNLATRLSALAADAGSDPGKFLPSAELRQTAVEPCELDSDPMRQLLDAYRQAFYALESEGAAP